MSKKPVKKHPRTSSPQNEDILKRVSLPVIILSGFLAYSNSFGCSFHFDSLLHIVYNNAIRDLSDVKTWWNYLPHRPVSIFTFVLNYHFAGLEAPYWHGVNIAIHVINGLLVRQVTLLILSAPALRNHPVSANKETFALFTALMFVVHPLATQSVTYIVQRMTSLAALFYLLSLTLYLKARLSEKGKGVVALLFAGAFLAALLAMFSKENAFTLPLAVLLVEGCFFREKGFAADLKDRRIILLLAALLAVGAFILVKFPLSVFDPVPPRSGHSVILTPVTYLLTQFSVIVKYIQLLVLPVNLHLEYDFPVSESFFQPVTLASFLLLSALLAALVLLFHRQRLVSFGILWFFLTLSIESSVIPIQDVIVEHRTYLPSFGFFLVLNTVIFRGVGNRSRTLALLAGILLIAIWSGMTYRRNEIWKDDLTLLNDNIAKAPNFARPYSNRGVAWWKRKEYDRAVSDFSRAILINPNYRDAWYNRGVVYEETGKFRLALIDYSRAIALDSTHIKACFNRGVVHFRLGELDQAVADYTRAIGIDAGYADAWNNRGVVFVNRKEYEKAIADFSRALDIRPDYTDALSNRGAANIGLGAYDEAVADYTRAITLRPDSKEAYVNRAIAYGNLGKWELAAADYTRALAIDPTLTQAAENREIALKKAAR